MMGAVTLIPELAIGDKEVTDTTGPEDFVSVRVISLADARMILIALGIVTPGDVDRWLKGWRAVMSVILPACSYVMSSITAWTPKGVAPIGTVSKNRRDKTHERIISRTSIRERKRARRMNDGPLNFSRGRDYSSSESFLDFFDFFEDLSAFLDFLAGLSSSPPLERI